MLKTCANCASFFIEGSVVSEDAYGLCLQEYDDELEPFIDDIMKNLHPYQNRKKLIEPLIETLFKTESNNQTRGWYKAVFEFLACCDLKESERYLQKMKTSNHSSYRIKKKIDAIILRENRFF